jgi:hypothetical protein
MEDNEDSPLKLAVTKGPRGDLEAVKILLEVGHDPFVSHGTLSSMGRGELAPFHATTGKVSPIKLMLSPINQIDASVGC